MGAEVKVTARFPTHPASSLPEPLAQGAVPAHGIGRGLIGGHTERCWLSQEPLCLFSRHQACRGSLKELTGFPVCWACGFVGPGRLPVSCSSCSV